jgi:hypothetical protein
MKVKSCLLNKNTYSCQPLKTLNVPTKNLINEQVAPAQRDYRNLLFRYQRKNAIPAREWHVSGKYLEIIGATVAQPPPSNVIKKCLRLTCKRLILFIMHAWLLLNRRDFEFLFEKCNLCKGNVQIVVRRLLIGGFSAVL